MFLAITQSDFDITNISNESFETTGFDAGGVVGAPHGAVQCDVPFDEHSTKSNCCNCGLQPGFMTGVANWHTKALSKCSDCSQVELFWFARISGRFLAKDQLVAVK